jgi:hypothetical protein
MLHESATAVLSSHAERPQELQRLRPGRRTYEDSASHPSPPRRGSGGAPTFWWLAPTLRANTAREGWGTLRILRLYNSCAAGRVGHPPDKEHTRGGRLVFQMIAQRHSQVAGDWSAVTWLLKIAAFVLPFAVISVLAEGTHRELGYSFGLLVGILCMHMVPPREKTLVRWLAVWALVSIVHALINIRR